MNVLCMWKGIIDAIASFRCNRAHTIDNEAGAVDSMQIYSWGDIKMYQILIGLIKVCILWLNPLLYFVVSALVEMYYKWNGYDTQSDLRDFYMSI